jgi:hypothetical protein
MQSHLASAHEAELDPLQRMLSTRQRELVDKQRNDLRGLGNKAWAAGAVGLLACCLYAAQFGTFSAFAQVLSLGVLLAGSAALASTLLGFLFGVPRALSASADSRAPEGSRAESSPNGAATERAASTNLEQISDWLSKILVGVALTRLHELPAALRTFSAWLGASMPVAQAGPFALGLIGYASVLGFLFGYVWTRVVLSPMFRQADEALRKAVVELSIAERSASKALARAASVEHSAGELLGRAREDAAELVSIAKQRAEQLEGVLQRMLERLYEPLERQGYAQTIRIADEYVEREGEPANFLFWLHYAAAQGQRATQEPEAYDDARLEALEAARKVLRQNQELGRYWLSLLWHPEHPQRTLGEDDLQVFFDDPEFKALLGNEPHLNE